MKHTDELAPPSMTTLSSQDSSISYSSSQGERDRKDRAASWFNAYTQNTNEKALLARAICMLISNTLPIGPLTIVDFGCGNGSLVELYIKPLKDAGYKITYYGIETEPSYIEETTKLLDGLEIETTIIDKSCFTPDVLQYLPKNPDFILASHVGYFGDPTALAENIKSYIGECSLALFVHQSKYSMVNELRKDFSSEVHTDVPLFISNVFREFAVTELDLPTQCEISAEYAAFPTTFMTKKIEQHREGESQETAHKIEFLVQNTKEQIRKNGESEKLAIAFRRIATNNKIIIWNLLQVFTKNEIYTTNAQTAFKLISRGQGEELPYIFYAIREGNFDQINRLISKLGENILSGDFLGIKPIVALSIAASKFIHDAVSSEKYNRIAQNIALSAYVTLTDLKNAREYCMLSSNSSMSTTLLNASRAKPGQQITTETTPYLFPELDQDSYCQRLEILHDNFPALFGSMSSYAIAINAYATHRSLEKVLQWLKVNIEPSVIPETFHSSRKRNLDEFKGPQR